MTTLIKGFTNTDDLEIDTTFKNLIWFNMSALDIEGVNQVEEALKSWKEENGYG